MESKSPTQNMDERLFFVIGAPRSGTTMLMRMLNVHTDIYTRPEPHLLTPLAHLGFYAHVDKAPYDQFQAAEASKNFVGDLPMGEADYVDALRAYTDVLYGRALASSEKRFFLDKTPAYALILPFIAKIYPKATFVVLTRHPFAIFSSFAKSFFDNDWEAANKFNPIIERYVPAIADFLRDKPVSMYHVRYESLVTNSEAELQGICAHAKMAYDPGMINYGEKAVTGEGLGDPIGVKESSRPNTASVHKWANEVVGNNKRMDILTRAVANLSDEDLAIWGYTRDNLWDPLADVSPEAAKKAQGAAKKWDRYHIERRALLVFRKNIRGSLRGRLLEKLRFYVNIMLR